MRLGQPCSAAGVSSSKAPDRCPFGSSPVPRGPLDDNDGESAYCWRLLFCVTALTEWRTPLPATGRMDGSSPALTERWHPHDPDKTRTKQIGHPRQVPRKCPLLLVGRQGLEPWTR